MSLKAVHIFFVVFATLISFGFGLLAIRGGWQLIGILSLVIAVVLPIYGVWFLKKLKDVSFV